MSICISTAEIVATQSFLSKTASLASTVIFTDSGSGGVYRISTAVGLNSLGNDVSVTAAWTDDFKSQLATVGEANSSQIFPANSVITIRLAASHTISISTTLSGGVGTYNLYVSVEQLS